MVVFIALSSAIHVKMISALATSAREAAGETLVGSEREAAKKRVREAVRL